MEAGKVDLLRLRQSDPVRYLKTAGIICIIFHQHIQVHPWRKYTTSKKCIIKLLPGNCTLLK